MFTARHVRLRSPSGVPPSAGATPEWAIHWEVERELTRCAAEVPREQRSATLFPGKAFADPDGVPEAVNGAVKPLTGLTDKVLGGAGTLLGGKQSTDGGSTGLNEKQEKGLLGFLFGGGE